MIDIILGTVIVAFVLALFAAVVVMCIGDTETFRVIDEKIARAIKGAERPRGEWIEVKVLPEVYDIEGVKTWGSKMQCDQCGFRFTAVDGHISQYNYCPNCGANMKGVNI